MANYRIGTGIFDVTGPAAEVGMLGMGELSQNTQGIMSRQYSRAFVIHHQASGKKVAVVVADIWSCTQAVKMEVVKRLRNAKRLTEFSVENVLISGTHTHSGPGGYSHYAFYNAMPMLGFVPQTFECIVNGIVESIVRAHKNLVAGDIFIGKGPLSKQFTHKRKSYGCGQNRSLPAYNNNPLSERRGQKDTDQEMVLLKFASSAGKALGVLSWYPIHPTSLGQKNRLISGDNKGYASYLFEREMGTNFSAASTFIAAFANSNCGDVSGNLAFGIPPGGQDDFDHMKRYGEMQFEQAKVLFVSTNLAKLDGPVDFRHIHVDMSNVKNASGERMTWEAAIGLSMLAGSTEDSTTAFSSIGEGVTTDTIRFLARNIKQQALSLISSSLQIVAPETSIPQESSWNNEFVAGHGKKPIVLPTGLTKPFPLTPQILPLQLLRIGAFAVAAIPAEITTMAGRRLRKTILANLPTVSAGGVVLAAYANAYSGYITTKEEYDMQHYEGASTHFGPHTLEAYQQEFARLANGINTGTIVPGSAATESKLTVLLEDLAAKQITLQTGVIVDTPPVRKKFGEGKNVVASHYLAGQEVVVQFWAGHPKNDLRTQSTFLKVQKKVGSQWTDIYTDHDFCTEFRWTRDVVTTSYVTISWQTTSNDVGTYRILHDGRAKAVTGTLSSYRGVSREFNVVSKLPTSTLYFSNLSDAALTVSIYHPNDTVRAAPHTIQVLFPKDTFAFKIPADAPMLLGKWNNRAQAAISGKARKTMSGGKLETIPES